MLNVCHFRSIKVNDDFSSFEVSDDVGVSDSVVEVQGQGDDVDVKANGDDVRRVSPSPRPLAQALAALTSPTPC